MKRKDKVEFALQSLATVQVIFETYFRMHETRDAEIFATEVDLMFDVAGVIGGHDVRNVRRNYFHCPAEQRHMPFVYGVKTAPKYKYLHTLSIIPVLLIFGPVSTLVKGNFP